MGWDYQRYLAIAEVTRKQVDDAFARMLVRFDPRAALERDEEDEGGGDYYVRGFAVGFHRHPAGCWFSIDKESCPSDRSPRRCGA